MKKMFLSTPAIIIAVVLCVFATSVYAAGIEFDKLLSVDGGLNWGDADDPTTGPVVTEDSEILFQYVLKNNEESSLHYTVNDPYLVGVVEGDLEAGEGVTITEGSTLAGPGNNQYNIPASVTLEAPDGTTYLVVDDAYYYSVIASELVLIDIKPGSDPNSINLKSKGVVPLALLSSQDFDATTIFKGETEPTIYFAGAEEVRWAIEDVNSDGLNDVIFHFETTQLNLDENSTQGDFTIGYSYDPVGNLIPSYVSQDQVNIVPKGNSNNSNNGNHGGSSSNGNNGNGNSNGNSSSNGKGKN